MEDHDLKVIDAMERYGDTFVRALAQCFLRADAGNYEILKKTFPEYWSNYEEISKRQQ